MLVTPELHEETEGLRTLVSSEYVDNRRFPIATERKMLIVRGKSK